MGRLALTLLLTCLLASLAHAGLPGVIKAASPMGEPYTVQVTKTGPLPIDPGVLSIAERYWQAHRRGGHIAELKAELLCEIDDGGVLQAKSCDTVDWEDPQERLALLLIARMPEASLPRFPAIDRQVLGLPPRGERALWSGFIPPPNQPVAAAAPFFRLALLTVRMGAAPAPAVDLSTGPLVEQNLVLPEKGSRSIGPIFPVVALRKHLGGRQTAECQVQPDLSVICHQVAFDPPQSASVFENTVAELYGGVRVQSQLGDGRDSAGVRFQKIVNWRVEP